MTAAEPRELRCAASLPIPTPVIYPSVRAIRARLHVGQPRAQRVRAYLASPNGAQAGVPHSPLPGAPSAA
jgi:hypothetical protein